MVFPREEAPLTNTLGRLPVTLCDNQVGSFSDFTKNSALPDQSSVSMFNDVCSVTSGKIASRYLSPERGIADIRRVRGAALADGRPDAPRGLLLPLDTARRLIRLRPGWPAQ